MQLKLLAFGMITCCWTWISGSNLLCGFYLYFMFKINMGSYLHKPVVFDGFYRRRRIFEILKNRLPCKGARYRLPNLQIKIFFSSNLNLEVYVFICTYWKNVPIKKKKLLVFNFLRIKKTKGTLLGLKLILHFPVHTILNSCIIFPNL